MTSHSYVGVHPERVIAYAYVRYPPTLRIKEPIFAFGALEITLTSGTDVVFKRHHHVYRREEIVEAYTDIFRLFDPDTHWVTSQPISPVSSKEACTAEQWLPRKIAGRLFLEPGRGQHHILQTSKLALSAFAADYSIPIAAQGASCAQMARLVPDRAQIIWLAWVTRVLAEDPDQKALIAAFRAWRLMDEQRSIPF